ncbi:hypothetical protein CDD83_6142 [Cordyceps sp. RAO-2017]|nr:hypothetical protein CDD83_6142 [Cordyceps sp. RAO-2017]
MTHRQRISPSAAGPPATDGKDFASCSPVSTSPFSGPAPSLGPPLYPVLDRHVCSALFPLLFTDAELYSYTLGFAASVGRQSRLLAPATPAFEPLPYRPPFHFIHPSSNPSTPMTSMPRHLVGALFACRLIFSVPRLSPLPITRGYSLPAGQTPCDHRFRTARTQRRVRLSTRRSSSSTARLPDPPAAPG